MLLEENPYFALVYFSLSLKKVVSILKLVHSNKRI